MSKTSKYNILSDSFWDRVFSKWEVIFLIIIIIFSFYLRVIYLDLDSMWIDETISALSANGIIEHGKPILESGQTYGRAEIFHYGMAGLIILFDGDFGARFISVIFGVLTVLLAYFFGKRFIGSSFGALSFAFLISVSSLEIIYSKQARFYQAFQFFYFLSFYLFYKFIILKERIWKRGIYGIVFLGMSVFMTIHLQTMGYIIFPLLIFFYILMKTDFKNLKTFLKNKYYILLLVIAIISSWYVFKKIKSLVYIDSFDRVLYYSQLYSNFYLEILPFIALSLFGLFLGLRKNWRLHLSFSLFVILPFVGLFFIKLFATRYVYFAIFALFFYIIFVLDKIHFKFPILITILLLFNGSAFSFDGIQRPNLDMSMPLADFKGAYEYINENRVFYSENFVTTWPPAALWYGDIKNEYWVWYSVDGGPSKWMSHNEKEVFTNSTIIRKIEEFPDNFTLIMDFQARTKIRPTIMKHFEAICKSDFESFNIEVFTCKKEFMINESDELILDLEDLNNTNNNVNEENVLNSIN